MTEPDQCHICGALSPLFTVHTVQMVDMPAMMINVFYCKKCAMMLDNFEQSAHAALVRRGAADD